LQKNEENSDDYENRNNFVDKNLPFSFIFLLSADSVSFLSSYTLHLISNNYQYKKSNIMKTKLFFTAITLFLFGNSCFSQQGEGGMKPPSIEERLKMINEKICQPLKLDNTQTEKVSAAFNDFFTEMEKLVDRSTNPPTRPEKLKVDALAKIRDDKVKQLIPEALYTKYLELEKSTRPNKPREDKKE
jgi:uncharacterized protein YfkK (UPF0435 family)